MRYWLSILLVGITQMAWAVNADYTMVKEHPNINQLTKELKAAGLPTDGCSLSGSMLTVHIIADLTDAQKDLLSQIVRDHVAQSEPQSIQDWKVKYAAAVAPQAKSDVIADYLGLR